MKPICLITAVSENNGIGIRGTIPWKLKKEMNYFTQMTTNTKDSNLQNAVVMGRKTWDSVPPKYRPFSKRLNVVISRRQTNFADGILSYPSVTEAVHSLQQGFSNIESIWIIGGCDIYKEALDSKLCDKLYITRIHQTFECDVFFPKFDEADYEEIQEEQVPKELQTENGLEYEFKIFRKKMSAITE